MAALLYFICVSFTIVYVTFVRVHAKDLDCSYTRTEDRFYYTNDKNESLRPAVRFCNFLFGPAVPAVGGGTPTKPREFPYMVAIGWPSALNWNSLDFKCGGVLISPKFVLTAAHCAYVNGIAPVAVLPGGPNLTDSSGTLYYIEKFIFHPSYHPDSNYHDIAIIQTEKEIGEKRACLWTNYELEDNDVTIIGYGDTRFAGSFSPQLLKADLLAVSNKECAKYFEADFSMTDGIIAKQLCAKDPQQYRDACQGDSGGPLIMKQCWNTYEIPFVVGITSFGYGCIGEPPGVYTRISEYLDWIEGIVWPNMD